MTLTKPLPGAGMTEKPCHRQSVSQSQPGIPGKGLSFWEMSAEQL